MTVAASTTERVVVVVTHPRQDSLIRATANNVINGLTQRGVSIRILDLDETQFDPLMSLEEKQSYGQRIPEELTPHVEALRWATRLVLVYPTWFSGHPARLKGWFDRVWLPGVAFDPPSAGGTRVRGRLKNIKRIDIVTTHGSSRWVNLAQGNSGQRLIRIAIRNLCARRCRVRALALYDVDRLTPADGQRWLDDVTEHFSS